MAAIRKRSDHWQVQVRRSGYPLLTRTFRTRGDAEAWGRLKEVELDRGEVIRVRRDLKSITLGDLLARYELEVTCHKRGAGPERARIKAMRRDPLTQTPLHQLSPSGFADYRDRRLSVVASGSVRRELAILQHCIEVAMVEWGVPLAANPVSKISKPKPGKARTRRLATQDHSALEAALLKCRSPIVRHVFLFALSTGMGRGEVLSLTWRNIDWCDRTALLPLTKNGESRLVPLSPSAVRVLQDRRWAYQLSPQDGGETVVFPISDRAPRSGVAEAEQGAREARFR